MFTNYLFMAAGLGWVGFYVYALIFKKGIYEEEKDKAPMTIIDKWFSDSKNWTEKITVILINLVVLGIGFIIFWVGGSAYFGKEEIGSYFQKPEYQTYYFVHLYPENTETKSYKVKGLISGSSGYDGNYYRLEEIYWPNGGKTVFDDCEINKEDNKWQGSCTDSEDEYWKFELAEKYE